MTVYRCEDSLEGIFTAVYLAWEEGRNHEDTYLSLHEEPLLFAEDVAAVPDWEKADKVMRTLNRRFGEKDAGLLCMALASEDEEKAQAVYRTIVDGFRRKRGAGRLLDNLADDFVNKVFVLARNVGRELDHWKGFARFQELENGTLYSRVGPKNNILPFLMRHFADRFPMENFVMYDDRRMVFGLHPAGRQWVLYRGGEAEASEKACPDVRFSPEEMLYQELFRGFCGAVTVEGRENAQLQRNMLPLWFREYMAEFDAP